MSHCFELKCLCGERTARDFNHGAEMLQRAVESSYPLSLLADTGWEIGDFEHYNELGGFITTHFNHGGFYIEGEYESDVPIFVQPKCPEGVYISVCLNDIEKRWERFQKEMETTLAQFRDPLLSESKP